MVLASVRRLAAPLVAVGKSFVCIGGGLGPDGIGARAAHRTDETGDLADGGEGVVGEARDLLVFRGGGKVFAGDNEPDAFDETVDRGEEVVEGGFGDFAPREDDEDAWAGG